MKKDLIKIGILALILSFISTIVIFAFGKTYTIDLKIPENNDLKVEQEDKSGQIEILEERRVGDHYYIKIKGKKPGKMDIVVSNGLAGKYVPIYIHKGNIITENNFFGKSTGSEIVPASFTILLLYIIYIIIKRYRASKKENLFQYRNIAYVGILVFLTLFTINIILSIFNYCGLTDTITKFMDTVSYFSVVLLPIALVSFIIVTISNMVLIKREGKSITNILGLCLGIFLCIATMLPEWTYRFIMRTQIFNIFDQNSFGPYAFEFFETTVSLVVTYIECILIGTIVIAIKAVKKKDIYDKDYAIILGCQIRKDGSLTPLLKGRVDRAIEFRNKQLETTGKDLKFIPSGGKGENEPISEAEAIQKYLIEQGIDKKSIIIEDQSKNTFENIKNSYDLVKDKKSKIVISTNSYHILRAGLIATSLGVKMDTIGSKTKAYFWINAFVREFIGTIYSERKKHLLVFFSMIFVIIMMIGITYLDNNM